MRKLTNFYLIISFYFSICLICGILLSWLCCFIDSVWFFFFEKKKISFSKKIWTLLLLFFKFCAFFLILMSKKSICVREEGVFYFDKGKYLLLIMILYINLLFWVLSFFWLLYLYRLQHSVQCPFYNNTPYVSCIGYNLRDEGSSKQ